MTLPPDRAERAREIAAMLRPSGLSPAGLRIVAETVADQSSSDEAVRAWRDRLDAEVRRAGTAEPFDPVGLDRAVMTLDVHDRGTQDRKAATGLRTLRALAPADQPVLAPLLFSGDSTIGLGPTED